MEFKFILYTLIAIGYFLYRKYQSLQNEAVKRKKELYDTITEKPVARKSFKTEVRTAEAKVKKARSNDLMQNKTKAMEVISSGAQQQSFQINTPQVNETVYQVQEPITSTEEEKAIFELSDIRKAVLWSEILAKPLALRTNIY